MTFNPKTPARELTPFGNFELHRSHLTTPVGRVPFKDEHVDADVRREAILTVCGHSTDAPAAAELMAMLGLDPAEGLR